MHPLIVESYAAITEVIAATRRIAVLGIKTEEQAGQPAFDVPAYLVQAGYDIVPVPVYYPDVTTILGKPVVRRIVDAAPVDMVNVFRRPRDLAAHLDDILAAKPKFVWLQLGIRDDGFAEALAAAGITVVQDRCLLVEVRARRSGAS